MTSSKQANNDKTAGTVKVEDLAPILACTAPAAIALLAENRIPFLSFVERRVGSRAEAEEILQTAFVKGLEKASAIRDTDSTVAWFYRLLRNSLTDHYRRRSAAQMAEERHRQQEAILYEPNDGHKSVCQCVVKVLSTLKPEYTDVIRRVDLGEIEISSAAASLRISPNNLRVRLHRARKALRIALELSCGSCATRGCGNCTCDS